MVEFRSHSRQANMDRPIADEHPESSTEFTVLLRDWESGEVSAFDRLAELAYPELRRIARRQCFHGNSSSTLQCTAVVHEAWLRLAEGTPVSLRDRTHFFAFAARLMRHILIDYARAKRAQKRGGVAEFSLLDSDAVSMPPQVEILELHSALEELEALDAAQGRIVELRYFGGLSIPETAETLGISESTVKREWVVAKTWIRLRLQEGSNRKP
jgi:RNA polymerase sigma factor (TIGR02999 family)